MSYLVVEIQSISFEIRRKPRIIRLAFVLAVQINVIKQVKGELSRKVKRTNKESSKKHPFFHVWFICQCTKLKKLCGHSLKVKVTQSCLTLCDSMVYRVHGILQARILQWVAVPFSRGSSQPRDWTQVSHIVGWFFKPGLRICSNTKWWREHRLRWAYALLLGHTAQHGEHGQCFIITVNGV